MIFCKYSCHIPSFQSEQHNKQNTNHAYGKVVIDDVVGYRIAFLRIIILLNIDGPSVQHRRVSDRDFVEDLIQRFVLIPATPVQTSGQVVAGAEGEDGYGRSDDVLGVQFV